MPVGTARAKRCGSASLQREDRVRIEVRDWGIGFDPKEVEGGLLRSAGHATAGQAAGRQVQHPKQAGQRHSHRRRVAGGGEGVELIEFQSGPPQETQEARRKAEEQKRASCRVFFGGRGGTPTSVICCHALLGQRSKPGVSALPLGSPATYRLPQRQWNYYAQSGGARNGAYPWVML